MEVYELTFQSLSLEQITDGAYTFNKQLVKIEERNDCSGFIAGGAL